MANKDSYARRHRYLDDKIARLEKNKSYNHELINDLKKQKLRLKDRMVTIDRNAMQDRDVRLAMGLGS